MSPQMRPPLAVWVKASALLAAASCVAGAFWYQAMTYINPDVGWLLHMARRSVHGAVLYRDLIEINPPLVIWLLYPVVHIAELTGISLEVMSNLAVGMLALGSMAWTLWLVEPDERWPALPVLALVCFIVPARSFGQREHLLLLCLLPYLGLVARRVRGQTAAPLRAALVGVAVAVGFALKPQFGLIWIGTAVYLATSLGLRRFLVLPETVTTVLAAPIYILAIAFFTPAYWTVLRRFGPLYLGFVPVRPTILLLQPTAMAALLGAGLWALVHRRVSNGALRDVLAIAAVGAVVGAVAQGKGFPYHYLPALAMSILLVVSLMGQWRPLTLTAGLLLAISGEVVYQRLSIDWQGFNRTTSPRAQFERMIRSTAKPADRIVVLVWQIRDIWPVALQLGEAYSYPMPSIWWLRALYPMGIQGAPRPVLHAPSEMHATERFLFEMTVKNLLETNPELIVMPRGSDLAGTQQLLDQEFDVARYFSQDRRVAQLFAKYMLESESGRVGVWRRRN